MCKWGCVCVVHWSIGSESNTATACSGVVQWNGQAFSTPVTYVTSEPVIKMSHNPVNVIQLLRNLNRL